MNLLDSIKSKKNNLKKTETIITYPDGKQYKLCKEGLDIIGTTSGFVIDTKPDKIPAKIIDYIYLGSQDCCDIEVLIQFKITTVLSIGIEPPVTYDNISYKFIECLDIPETDINVVISNASIFINECVSNENNILVHCNAGVSRSASVVIGYLILYKKYSYSQAFEVCKNARSCIKPNVGFERQLKLLEK